MHITFARGLILCCALTIPGAGLYAQPEANPNITVTAELLPDFSKLPQGPELKGIITAKRGNRIRVAAADGATSIVLVTEATEIRGGGRRPPPTADTLVPGLPVTIKTLQWSGGLAARRISFKGGDLRTAMMIHNATAQKFEEQSAATAALRGRMGDIDKYNIKDTTNVYFDVGKSALSGQARTDLCTAAAKAEATDNALMLVVGYTDSTGSQEFNQTLSERRASAVINYLQQACRWKPYRMLTPTGMAMADPLASNDTEEGRRQNRRVAVNILVSKSVDGM